MTTIFNPVGTASPARAEGAKAATRRVVDAPTRLMHALLAMTFVGAYVTADGERWRLMHVTLGYTLAGVFVARLLWGMLGPRPARLSSLWRKLQAFPAWLKAALAGRMDGRGGQNLAMALAIALLLALIAPLTLSGYGVYQEWAGDWLEGAHEFFGNAMLALVLAHIALVLGMSVLRRRNLVTPMVTGRTAGAGPDLVKRPYTALAALLLVAVFAFWAWQWQQAPVLHGAAAQSQSHDDDD